MHLPVICPSDSSLAACSEDDTIGDLKKLVAAQTGTRCACICMHQAANEDLCSCGLTQQLETLASGLGSRHTTEKLHACRPEKIRIQKWYTIYKDHIMLSDYEIHDGMGLELYYN